MAQIFQLIGKRDVCCTRWLLNSPITLESQTLLHPPYKRRSFICHSDLSSDLFQFNFLRLSFAEIEENQQKLFFTFHRSKQCSRSNRGNERYLCTLLQPLLCRTFSAQSSQVQFECRYNKDQHSRFGVGHLNNQRVITSSKKFKL